MKNKICLTYKDYAFVDRLDYYSVYKSYNNEWPVFLGILFKNNETLEALYERAKNQLPENKFYKKEA